MYNMWRLLDKFEYGNSAEARVSKSKIGSNGVRDGGGLAFPWSIVEKRTGLDQPGNLGG